MVAHFISKKMKMVELIRRDVDMTGIRVEYDEKDEANGQQKRHILYRSKMHPKSGGSGPLMWREKGLSKTHAPRINIPEDSDKLRNRRASHQYLGRLGQGPR
jgi:hypothetical protein